MIGYETPLFTVAGSSAASSASDCGLGFETGHSYLIYAFDDGQNHIATNACSRTASLARARRDIAILKKITFEKPHSGNWHVAAAAGVEFPKPFAPETRFVNFRGIS